jgi:DhnA family fructose-bisphosphate aldolase class Ia
MDTAGTESHVLVLAIKLKGEVTWAPLAGVFTVMADAGAMPASRAKVKQKRPFMLHLQRSNWLNMKENCNRIAICRAKRLFSLSV